MITNILLKILFYRRISYGFGTTWGWVWNN